MNRAEHLKWCKERAMEYVNTGNFDQAFASIVSDLGKHPETAGSIKIAGMLGFSEVLAAQKLPGPQGKERMKSFIEGFN